MAYKTTNPATGLVTESFDNISDGALAASLDELERGFRKDWPLRPIAERSRIVARASQIIRDDMRSFPETWESLFRTR
jgi:succinate-semialdehyde dehydrogenase / glutarate-semialdehyde dehydrogenase